MELTSGLHAFLWTSPGANNCNTYLVHSTTKNILIDPGHAAHFDHVSRALQQQALSVDDIDLIICTHAHPDHLEAVSLFRDTPALFTLHSAEWRLVVDMAAYLRSAMNFDPDKYAPDFFLKAGELKVGDIELTVLHTPGHSPGSISLHWPAGGALFTGDVIFNNGLGRTDLPGGDGEQLKNSIRKLSAVNARWLLSGHGEPVAGADAVKANFEQVEQMWVPYI